MNTMKLSGRKTVLTILTALLLTLNIFGASAQTLSGTIIIDGSSTVFPITEAVAEEFHKLYPDISTPIGVSRTGGGFNKFIAGEPDISNVSRPIQDRARSGACGLDHGSAWDTEIWPPLAKLVSSPASGCRSTTVT